MNFDLGVWKGREGLSPISASFVYDSLCRGEQPAEALAAQAALHDFYEELIAIWPEVPSGSMRRPVDSPWSGPLHRSDYSVLLSCDWQHAEVVLALITRLAARHGLSVFDPQSEELYLPDAG